jgi:hypothetical protein
VFGHLIVVLRDNYGTQQECMELIFGVEVQVTVNFVTMSFVTMQHDDVQCAYSVRAANRQTL